MFGEPVQGVSFHCVTDFLDRWRRHSVCPIKISTFYSTYDARELVRMDSTKDRFCLWRDGSWFFDFRGDEAEKGRRYRSGAKWHGGGRSETSKSISYGCRIQTTGDDAFKVGTSSIGLRRKHKAD